MNIRGIKSGLVLTGPLDGRMLDWSADVYECHIKRPETEHEAFLDSRREREPFSEVLRLVHVWHRNDDEVVGFWVPEGKDLLWAYKTLAEKYQEKKATEVVLTNAHRCVFESMTTGPMTSLDDIKRARETLEGIEKLIVGNR